MELTKIDSYTRGPCTCFIPYISFLGHHWNFTSCSIKTKIIYGTDVIILLAVATTVAVWFPHLLVGENFSDSRSKALGLYTILSMGIYYHLKQPVHRGCSMFNFVNIPCGAIYIWSTLYIECFLSHHRKFLLSLTQVTCLFHDLIILFLFFFPMSIIWSISLLELQLSETASGWWILPHIPPHPPSTYQQQPA